ncbi:hypothetical protein [Neorhizobium sp. DAR64860/K0K1]|uniref:hypothetical protein n=1 Tax=Neorhizobium sp. DAR64860/K0K1 TaxID=3421955 RepID=UPI003D26ECF4
MNDKALIVAAQKLVQSVEKDVNGIHGKGGNGGLTSDDTIRAAGEVRVLLSKLEDGRCPR